MSWINSVRNVIPFLPKRETPDALWEKCGKCGQMIFRRELEENSFVCPKCDDHKRIGPAVRFRQLFDEGSWSTLASPRTPDDPLKFRDTKRYTERLKAARAATGEVDALLNAQGLIRGHKAVVGVQDFAFMGGSMGTALGAAFVEGVRHAVKARCPYVICTASGGARMQEGTLSLMQMPRTTAAIAELHDASLPYIVVLTDPTTGGVTASYAMLGDVQMAEPNALIAFAGQRVIQDTIGETLPEGFQRAEYLLDHGMIDMVIHRHGLRERLAMIIGYLCESEAA